MAHSPFEHTQDGKEWALFEGLKIPMPGPIHIPYYGDFQLTRFMVIEVIAAALLLLIFVPLCRRASTGGLPRGPFWNAFEGLLTFVRDEIARPNLGEHDADRFVPFLWTLFLFILTLNLLGMLPLGFGSPTASIWVTGALAVVAFFMLHVPAIVKMGPGHYLKSQWPHIEVPYVGWLFGLAILGIEMLGTVIKSGVLAIRLFANMFAGHTVLAVILGFIVLAAGNLLVWPVVTVASVAGVAGLSLLELFVAFLQAYIFVFLTALFMGMSLHPAH